MKFFAQTCALYKCGIYLFIFCYSFSTVETAAVYNDIIFIYPILR